jgi:amidophosphoribosyltransferase
MSDAIKHECGLAYIRLLKPLPYYHQKYGTAFYGLNKLCLLMEKQHNRGQDGAGIAAVKLHTEPGQKYINSLRFTGNQAITQIFQSINQEVAELQKMYPEILQHPQIMKGYMRFMGEILLGHLRYGTQGKNNVEFCHPFTKPNIIPSRHLTMAGNFNLVNTTELFERLHSHPSDTFKESDLGALIETVHHFLVAAQEENPENKFDLVAILNKATSLFDGGYVFCGLIGSGDSFVMRDANGIRPCHYYLNDDFVVAASERSAIMTAFNVKQNDIQELAPGHAIIVGNDGKVHVPEILPARTNASCSFERIYFSRGSDPDIYKERMQLGRNLADEVLKALDYHLRHTIVSFIPNTAEIAFYGLIKGLEDYLKEKIKRRILAHQHTLTPEELTELLGRRIRIEKIAIKDVKMRTFITEDASRNEMVQHVYDITYGTVQEGKDTLVIIDDSIVRGTTLKESIIRMLDRLGPKKIIVVSSAPQIRYPDCYGIDMSKMGDFIAFQAAVALLHEQGKATILDDCYEKCVAAAAENRLHEKNYVQQIYEPFATEEISKKVAELICDGDVKAEVEVIFQSLEGLRDACPASPGDWYFTGNYPTPGGNKVANRAFMNYMERNQGRGY